MADRGKAKESTPPPLLLMPASQGLTFDANEGLNILMPVPQTEASLIASDEDGEVDSFLGQSQPASSPISGFQSQPNVTHSQPQTITTPLQGRSHPVSQAAPGSFAPPPTATQLPSSTGNGVYQSPTGMVAPPMGAAPPTGPAQNYRRMPGRPQYAPPPPGTYAPPSQLPSTTQSFVPPSLPGQSLASSPDAGASGSYTSMMTPPSSHGEASINYGAPPQNYNTPPTTHNSPPSAYGVPASVPGNMSSSMDGTGLMSTGPLMPYIPVQYHWFYSKHIELRQTWQPFSVIDSDKLEEAYKQGVHDGVVVSTDGGRYDVDLLKKTRTAIYWDEVATQVRRASWFFRPEGSSRLVPFEEDIAEKLENIYKETVRTNDWHRRHELPNGEVIVMHNTNAFVSFSATAQPDEWGNTQTDTRPRVVKRGLDEVENIPEGEPTQVDHVVFVVHGIGSTCDLRFRNIIECVDDFRKMSLTITGSHFKRYQDEGKIGRVEYLPVRWHQALHGDVTGIDRKLKAITLSSIGKLRHYTNDTLLDILFYTSPKYAQQIADTVGSELNRLYELFVQCNPGFKGSVSVAGHSLGSLILFDLLTHQVDKNAPAEENKGPITPSATPSGDNGGQNMDKDELRKSEDDTEIKDKYQRSSSTDTSGSQCTEDPLLHSVSSTSVQYMIGVAGTGAPCVQYPQLKFNPANFFALGSPIAMFLTVRGVEMLGEEFHFPTCPGFFNIFHPFDPVAYRLEPMITPMFPPKPFLMPHHKGRKRLHLELKENLARVGSDLKQKMISYFRATWKTLNEFALAHRTNLNEALEQEMDNVMSQVEDDTAETASVVSSVQEEIFIGSLNQGHRIDYVLQEKPIESFNDYLFALGSHCCYWESEDTVLLILKEIYALMGLAPIRPGQENMIPISQTAYIPPAFPRHPMASAAITQPTAHPPMGSGKPMGYMPTMGSAPPFGTASQMDSPPSMGAPQAMGTPPSVGASPSMGAPPAMGAPPSMGVPPAMGAPPSMGVPPPIGVSPSMGNVPNQGFKSTTVAPPGGSNPSSQPVGAPPLSGFVPKA